MRKPALAGSILWAIPDMLLLVLKILLVGLLGTLLLGIPGFVLLVSLLALGIFVREVVRQIHGNRREEK